MKHTRRAVWAATWLSYFGFYVCRKTWGIVKADVQIDLHLSTAQIANIGTVYLVTYMLGMWFAAGVGRGYGPRKLLLGGMLCSIGCNVAFGFATTYGALAGLMAANGFVQAAGWPGNVGLLSQWFCREERGAVMAWWTTCYSVGNAAAKAFAGVVVAWAIAHYLPGYAWSWAFWASSIVLLLIVAFFAWGGREAQSAPVDADAATAPSAGIALRAYFSLLRNPTVLLLGGGYFCFKFLRYAIDSWGPYIFRHLGLDTPTAAFGSTLFDWAGIAGTILCGTLSDRVFHGRRASVALLSTIGMVVAFLFSYFAHSANALIVAYGLVGLFLYGPDSLVSGAAAADVGEVEGGAVAAAGIISGIGSCGPIVQEELVPRLLFVDGQLQLGRLAILFVGVSLIAVATLTKLYVDERRGVRGSV